MELKALPVESIRIQQEFPTPPTSPPHTACPGTISRVVSTLVEPSRFDAVGEVNMNGLGDAGEALVGCIKSEQTDGTENSPPVSETPSLNTTHVNTTTATTTQTKISDSTTTSPRPSLQRASTSPEHTIPLADRLIRERQGSVHLDKNSFQKESKSTASNLTEQRILLDRGLREKRRRRQSSDSRGAKNGRSELLKMEDGPNSTLPIGVGGQHLERPPLHTYTSFQSEFSCPPPSPPPSPTVPEKTWWRNL